MQEPTEKGLFDALADKKGSELTDREKDAILVKIDMKTNDEGFYVDAFGSKISYNGAKTMKKTDTKLALTEVHKNEIYHCMNDFKYFRKHYCKVVNRTGITRPEPRQYQEDAEDAYLTGEDVVLFFPRQSGKTVTTAIYLLWKAMFFPNINIGIAANVQKLSTEVLDKIKKIFLELPIWLQSGVTVWNKQSIEFDNGTRVLTSATSSDSFRGYSIHILYVDEVAFIKNGLWEEFSDSVFPAQAALQNSQAILSSTAGGMNHFYALVKGARKKAVKDFKENENIKIGAKNMTVQELYNLDSMPKQIDSVALNDNVYTVNFNTGINGYLLSEASWTSVPRFNKDGSPKTNDDFRSETVAKFSQMYFEQNFGGEFLGSSATLITGSVLKSLSWVEEDEITFNNIFQGLRIFNEPEPGKHYILTVDPKKDGIDDAGIQVIDVTGLPFKQVACANLQESYLTAPSKVFDLGMYYNEALVVVENNLDQTIVDALFYHYEYENIYKESHKKIQGFRTTTRTKKQILSFMKKFIEEGKLIIQDELTVNQLFSFIEKSNGSFSAEEGYKDDMAMALALTFAVFLEIKNFDDFQGMISLIEAQKKAEDVNQESMSAFFDLGFNDELEDKPQSPTNFNGFDIHDAGGGGQGFEGPSNF